MQICTETPISSETESLANESEPLSSEEAIVPKLLISQPYSDQTSDWFPLVTKGSPSSTTESNEENSGRWPAKKSLTSLTTAQSHYDSFSSNKFKTIRSAKACSTAWRWKMQPKPATCPSTNKRFTFENPSRNEPCTNNWADLLWHNRFENHNMQWQAGGDQNGWRRSLSDGWATMPMTPATPVSHNSQMGWVSPSLEMMNYVSGLNRIDMSPKNPDAFVMNTPKGKFMKSPTGKWFPMQPNQPRQFVDPKVRQQALRDTARKKTKQAERDFGHWCKNRQARSEFSTAIMKAAEEPYPPDGATE